MGILVVPGRDPPPTEVSSLAEDWGGALTVPFTGEPSADILISCREVVATGATLLRSPWPLQALEHQPRAVVAQNNPPSSTESQRVLPDFTAIFVEAHDATNDLDCPFHRRTSLLRIALIRCRASLR